MSRVARVTEYLGRDGGGFYVEAPDIPEGLTVAQWRRGRMAVRPAVIDGSGLAPVCLKRAPSQRSALRWRPALRPAT